VADHRASLVVRSTGNVAIVYFTDSRLLEEMQIKWVGSDLYDLVDKQFKTRLIISFQNVQRFSTALLGKLIGLKKKTVLAQGNVKLCSIPPNIMEIFRVTGLDAAFDIYNDENAAIKSFGSTAGE